jgi:RimJ/RimL family protein N-acetyltransferase
VVDGFVFRLMDEVGAREVLAWRYPPPYDVYNASADRIDADVKALLDPENSYYLVCDSAGTVLAYCCYGPDARVPGGDYRADALDVGLGVRPDLTGRGQGSRHVSAVLQFGHTIFGPTACRVTVARFNGRALRVWRKAGFQQVQTFRRKTDGMPFVVLMRSEDVVGLLPDR